MWTRKFWRDATERALSTAAQAASLVVGKAAIDSLGVNAFSVDWATVGGFAAGGFVLAILKAVAAAKTVGPMDSASLDPNAG